MIYCPYCNKRTTPYSNPSYYNCKHKKENLEIMFCVSSNEDIEEISIVLEIDHVIYEISLILDTEKYCTTSQTCIYKYETYPENVFAMQDMFFSGGELLLETKCLLDINKENCTYNYLSNKLKTMLIFR